MSELKPCPHSNVHKFASYCLDCGLNPEREELNETKAKLQIARNALKDITEHDVHTDSAMQGLSLLDNLIKTARKALKKIDGVVSKNDPKNALKCIKINRGDD